MEFEDIYSELIKASSHSTSKRFSQTFEELFSAVQNPYHLLMSCIQRNKEIYLKKNNTITGKICFEFEKFIARDTQGKFQKSLTRSLQTEAFYIATRIKDKALFLAFINCFHLSENPDLVCPLLFKELEQGKAKEVATFAMKLELQSRFSVHNLLIPLFMEDSISVLENFLDSSPPHREPFLKTLDKITSGEITIGDFIHDSGVRKFNGDKSSKFITKLGFRLLKKYEMDSSVCQNMAKKQKLGAVKYLFYRRYVAEELSQESFLHFLKDVALETPSLRDDILDLFLDYYDSEQCACFVKLVDCSDLVLPSSVKDALEKGSDTSASLKSLSLDDDHDFYPLKKPYNSIQMICKVEEFDNAMKALTNSSVIAVDSEWKPSFQVNAKEELSLIQIATHKEIFLFDMISLPLVMQESHWQQLGSLFSNKNIQKLSYAFKSDITCMSKLSPQLKFHLGKCSNLIDFNDLKKVFEDSYPQLFSFEAKNDKGLSELVQLCFGNPLNKKQQLSYWSARPLSKEQIIYAALDANCLLDIKAYLDQMCLALNIPNWITLKKINKKIPESKIKSNSTSPPQQRLPACPASEFKVVCDNMVQGLGRLLRHSNIDTMILGSYDHHDQCVNFYENEGRVALTRGNVYHHLCNYIPESHVFSIQSDDPKEQLKEVVGAFNVIIKESDVFGRCAECNNYQYLYVPPNTIRQMKASNQPSRWISVQGGRVNIGRALTGRNTKIAFEDIHPSVLEKVKVVYVCNDCGKCYWDGSHYNRVLKNTLSHVIQPDVPCDPVPPPPSKAAS